MSQNFSIFVGIDISKHKFNACAIQNPNSIIFESAFDMSKQGFSSFVQKLSVFPKSSVLIAMESTGCYHLNLSSFPSAKAIQKASIDSLRVFFSKTIGRKLKLTPETLKELANNSIAQYWPVKEKILIQTIKELRFLQQQLNEFDEMLKEYCKCASLNQDVEILTSIDGIGENSALYFLAEVGDISRFSTYKKLIAYCGLDPSVDESGKHKGESRISKRGNAHLRRIIWLMSVNVVRHNEYFKAYFQRKRAQGLVYKKAMMSVAHKLLRTIFAMMKKREKFNIDHTFSSSTQNLILHS